MRVVYYAQGKYFINGMFIEPTCLSGKRFTVESYIILLIHSSYLNGVAGGGSQSSQ